MTTVRNEIFWLMRRLKFAVIAFRCIRGASIHGDTYTAVFVNVPPYRFNGRAYKLTFEVR